MFCFFFPLNLLTYRLQSYWWNSSLGAQHREFQTDSKSHQTVGQTWVLVCQFCVVFCSWYMSQLILCENQPHSDLKWPAVFVGISAVNEKQHCSIVPQEIRLACICCLATCGHMLMLALYWKNNRSLIAIWLLEMLHLTFVRMCNWKTTSSFMWLI